MSKGTANGTRPPTTEELIREATREAHQAIKDVRAERKALADDLAAARAACLTLIEEAVAKELGELGTQTAAAIEAAKQAVYARFDRIADVLTFTDPESRRQGVPGLEELANAARVLTKVGAVSAAREITLDDGRVALVVEV